MNLTFSRISIRLIHPPTPSPRLMETQIRCLFSAKTGKKKEKMKILSEPPANRTSDYIGPPHPVSNIRPVQFHVPMNETATEKDFRLRRAALLEWNQQFWSKHNHTFFKEKNEFVKQHKEAKGGGKENLSPQEISIFYKQFLDKNRSSQLQYNKEWYKKHFDLLWPAVKVVGIKMWRSLSQNMTKN